MIEELTQEQIFKKKVQEVKGEIVHRHQAYLRVFNMDNPDVQIVMEDLKRFCRAEASSFHEDARVHAMLEGRREVFLRIDKNLKLSSQEMWEQHNKGLKYDN